MITATALRQPISPASAEPLRVLAYVHLRNIHDSTGAGRVARQLTEHLARRPDVELRVLADAMDREKIVPLVQQPWNGFRYHTFAADTTRQQAKWFWLRNPKAETFWSDAQIVFCTAESFVPVQTAKLAVTVHDAAYFEEAAHRRDRAYWKQRMKWTLLFRELARTADMIHTVSHFSADRLAYFFPAMRSRLRVVHNAVSPRFFTDVPAAGRRYLEAQGLADRRFVLIPGGLHFRKNAELILQGVPELLRQDPGLIIAVVNHSDPAYAQRAHSLAPSFRMLGFVPDEALHALYAAATVVWFPSRYEGFGLPVIEAMACGAPVVASNSSSLPEIAATAGLLVDPADAQAHVAALLGLLHDPLACTQLAAAGRERAGKFTWDASAEALKRHFDALL